MDFPPHNSSSRARLSSNLVAMERATRSRRAVDSASASRKSALAELAAHRTSRQSGSAPPPVAGDEAGDQGDQAVRRKRRIDTFELKEEDRLYDVVDESEYQKIVAQRRVAGENFVVDDNGLGYADTGLEDVWDRRDDDDDSWDEDEDGGRRKKKDKKPAGPRPRREGVAARKALSAAAAMMGKRRGASNMFAAAGARAGGRQASALPAGEAQAAEALLEELINDIGPDAHERLPDKRRRRGAPSIQTSPSRSLIVIFSPFRQVTVWLWRSGCDRYALRVASTRAAREAPRLPRRFPRRTCRHAVKRAGRSCRPQQQQQQQPPPTPFPDDSPFPEMNPAAGAREHEGVNAGAAEGGVGTDPESPSAKAEPNSTARVTGGGAGMTTGVKAESGKENVPGAAAGEGVAAGNGAVEGGQSAKPDSAEAGQAPKLHARLGALAQEENASAAWHAVSRGSAGGLADEKGGSPDRSGAAAGGDKGGWAGAAVAGQTAVTGSAAVAGLDAPVNVEGLPLDADGKLPFFFLDAVEESYGALQGTVFLFGKVPVKQVSTSNSSPSKGVGQSYVSCCVGVQGVQRCVFAVPREGLFDDPQLAVLEAEEKQARDEDAGKAGGGGKSGNKGGGGSVGGGKGAEESERVKAARLKKMRKLHELATPLKEEIRQRLMERHVSSFCMMPVKRSYAFERKDIPRGEQYVLKITYPYSDAPLPSDLTGTHFTALMGTHTSAPAGWPLIALLHLPILTAFSYPPSFISPSLLPPCFCLNTRHPIPIQPTAPHPGSALELLLLKRRLKCPCWLAIDRPTRIHPASQRSHCRVEVSVASPKLVAPAAAESDPPPLVVASLNVKTVVNHGKNVNEVAAVSVVFCRSAKVRNEDVKWCRVVLNGALVVRTLVVAPLNVKTVVNHGKNVNEVAAVSVVFCRSAKRCTGNGAGGGVTEREDGGQPWQELPNPLLFSLSPSSSPLPPSCTSPLSPQSFNLNLFPSLLPSQLVQRVTIARGNCSAIQELSSEIFPLFPSISTCPPPCDSSERELLSYLLARMGRLDADVIIGHGLAAFDLTVLLQRMQACRVGNWSAIGRLKRTQMPKLGGGLGSSWGGGGAAPGLLSAVAGRLLIDTSVSSREILPKEVSHSLSALAASQLGHTRREVAAAEVPGMYGSSESLMKLDIPRLGHVRREVAAAEVPGMYGSSESLMKLVGLVETDAWLALSLMFHLSVLPLSRQLTNLSGNLWNRTLQRIEYLLLHEFHRRKFMLPDKLTTKEKEAAISSAATAATASGKKKKRKGAGGSSGEKQEKAAAGGAAGEDTTVTRGVEGGEEEEGDDEDAPEGAEGGTGGAKGKKGGGGGGGTGEGKKKGPGYAGGLVLEPKRGLYDKIVVLLDFNSLYPSIIREYNICFTTVSCPDDASSLPQLPDPDPPGVLPEVLGMLVQRRRQVKDMLKRENDPDERQRLDIRQQALKLTANRYEWCWSLRQHLEVILEMAQISPPAAAGYPAGSRRSSSLPTGAMQSITTLIFAALPRLLPHISQGRDILQSTVDLVQNNLNLEVIYGDIHSIIINSTVLPPPYCCCRPLLHRLTPPPPQGRDILQSTVDLVQNNLNLEVIYGDTDSIMINTGLDDPSQAIAIAHRVKKEVRKEGGEVNKRYKLLEIEMDGLFRSMLLLNKKKYASMKLILGPGEPPKVLREVAEHKGLDIVRRDWSVLSKEIGAYCLKQILSGRPREEVVEAIHTELRNLAARLRAGEVDLTSFVITKTLTKPPSDYPDASSQPHVQVALRRKKEGRTEGCNAGDAIPYVIAVPRQPGSEGADAAVPPPGRSSSSSSSSAGGIAERARHVDELRSAESEWDVDREYYLAHQVHPVVARLCAPIEGTDAARLADCLGLDSSKYRHVHATASTVRDDAMLAASSILDDDERSSVPPAASPVPSSSIDFSSLPPLPPYPRSHPLPPFPSYSRLPPLQFLCPSCRFPFAFPGVPAIAQGREREISEADLYHRLCYLRHSLAVTRTLAKVRDPAQLAAVERKLQPIRRALDAAHAVVEGMCDSSAYKWVKMGDLCVT
ncbi:unnamed protein product [Closterium sp. Yama58-4]|nr:unnamed protein product [Closterium sp. Yama58-4]